MNKIQESLAAVETALAELRAAGGVEMASLLIQTTGGQRYVLYPRTLAANVDMGDGTDLLTRFRNVERGLAGNTSTRVVETVAERDALTGIIPGDRCVVLDATADPSVEKGGAEYIWMPAKGDAAPYWRKMSEEESQDIVLSWESIQGRPAQPVERIDAAALLAHEHDNKCVLDSLGKDESGRLTIGGTPVDDGMRDCLSAKSLGDAIPEALRDGGIIVFIQD